MMCGAFVCSSPERTDDGSARLLDAGTTCLGRSKNTESPSNSPLAFRTKIIQGLFDGDGCASVKAGTIQFTSEQNCDLVHRLLKRAGINSCRNGKAHLVIQSAEDVARAVDLPIFLSATGRQENAKIIASINEASHSKGSLHNMPLMRKILEIREREHALTGVIRFRIFDEFGVVLNLKIIRHLVAKGLPPVNTKLVSIYFALLERVLQESDVPLYCLVRRIKEETGYQESLSKAYDWLHKSSTPKDAKFALSDGYELSLSFLEAYPHLRKYVPEIPA
jgi:hypothetical protein